MSSRNEFRAAHTGLVEPLPHLRSRPLGHESEVGRSDAEAEFAILMSSLRAGNRTAFRTVVQRYGAAIRRIIRRRMDPRLRARFDTADFEQDVWMAVLAPSRAPDHFFSTPRDLVAFLGQLARNKVVDARRRCLHSGKRDLRRECALEDLSPDDAGALIDPAPTPATTAALKDHWQHLLKGQPEHYRRLLELLRQGRTQEEAAAVVGMNVTTVRRMLRRLGQQADRDAG
jgi:RNA polymerase sigma factor (sigma-70 family)